MLASLHLRENEKEFEHFIPQDKGGFTNYLRSDVEALKAEADHLQTVALSRSVDVPITIYCLENIQKGGPQKVNTIENKKSCYDLLFRPGHYDVLYRGTDKNNTNDNNEESKTNDTIQSSANDNNDHNMDKNKTESKEQDTKKQENQTDKIMDVDSNTNNNNNNGNDSNALSNNGNTKSD